MPTTLLQQFQPLLTAITPSFQTAVIAYVAISAIVGVFIWSSTASKLLLTFIRGPDRKAGWSDEKKAAYQKYKERSEFRRELMREDRSERRRERGRTYRW